MHGGVRGRGSNPPTYSISRPARIDGLMALEAKKRGEIEKYVIEHVKIFGKYG
jgi:hypothetical protein